MTARKRHRRVEHRRRTLRSSAWMAGAIVAALVLLVWALSSAGNGGSTAAAPTSGATPVASGQVASQSGVHVDAALVAFGRVPLDVTVTHSFLVSNDGPAPVHLGRAAIAVLDGC